MGIGIEKTPVFTIWDVPLMGHSEDKSWSDNTWLVDQLRQLADMVERDDPNIYSIGLKSNHQYNAPTLVIEFFEKREWEKKKDGSEAGK